MISHKNFVAMGGILSKKASIIAGALLIIFLLKITIERVGEKSPPRQPASILDPRE